ncbi:MAG: hypothetical protein E7394_05270 [Ruminococcaceae bacterium]|nr:hypothetical protein [Oscillospiraceae bacterium]
MKNKSFFTALLCFITLLFLSGCSSVGDKTASISVVYAITAIVSFLLVMGYFLNIKKKDVWFIILFISVSVVNTGYYWLSVSKSLPEALWANRLSYLGSVFLPLSMTMAILKICFIEYKKWISAILFSISVIVFIIAASPGYVDIYYKSANLEFVDGVSVLVKEYGPWHCIYLFYLVGYFLTMSISAIYAVVKKKIESPTHAIIIIIAVFVNFCVWLLEQFVKIDFEILSVSYIISELFLLVVYVMVQKQEVMIESLKAKLSRQNPKRTEVISKDSEEFREICKHISDQLPTLTPSERCIYNCYLGGMSTKEVMHELSISENTLKFHNKNIYGKLGVSSRKQLVEYARYIESEQSDIQ